MDCGPIRFKKRLQNGYTFRLFALAIHGHRTIAEIDTYLSPPDDRESKGQANALQREPGAESLVSGATIAQRSEHHGSGWQVARIDVVQTSGGNTAPA